MDEVRIYDVALSAEQVAALQQLKAEQEAQRKLAELHRQAGEPPGPPPDGQ